MKTSDNRIRTWIAARRTVLIAAVCCLDLTAGALLLQAQTGISELWVRFPDNTVQQTAAHNCFDPANPDDEMIRVGGICIDKYEASIWDAPVGGTQIVGFDPTDYCSPNGQDCSGIYARSVPNVPPATNITWFQAQAALANSGKRLPTNGEWQMAVLGTPDPGDSPGPGDCNTTDLGLQLEWTGQRENCVSHWGHYDMVGNAWEWVSDWIPTNCASSWGSFSNDVLLMCPSGGSADDEGPGAVIRGGDWDDGALAGPFVLIGNAVPWASSGDISFRSAC